MAFPLPSLQPVPLPGSPFPAPGPPGARPWLLLQVELNPGFSPQGALLNWGLFSI